jgi:ABC-type transport system involved in multi-copper enzyme maturation permease subunit
MSLALRQTKALFLDAYRELNARKLFWVTLGLSLLVVAVCACIGVKGSSVTFLGWTVNDNLSGPMSQPAKFYKAMFVTFGIGFWLTWAAMILALISSASVFPDFLSGGAIELVLSKPIGRLRLFLTKYATGLMFTAIQVGVFTLGCFLLLGVRGGSWEPRMFLAIPIVVGMYSFLFCMCVLLGVLTRSTIASLLLTLLLWFLVFLVNVADASVASFAIMNEVAREKLPAIFRDADQLVVLGVAVAAAGGAGLDLAAVGRDGEVGDRRVLGLARAVAQRSRCSGCASRG